MFSRNCSQTSKYGCQITAHFIKYFINIKFNLNFHFERLVSHMTVEHMTKCNVKYMFSQNYISCHIQTVCIVFKMLCCVHLKLILYYAFLCGHDQK